MNKLLIISGPTATGKTSLAIKLAKKFNGELISADSRQIYRGMDIGTGKDHPPDIKIHLVDIINPDTSFSVAQYRQLALEKISEIYAKGKLPIIVGGTGQYIDAIVNPQPTFSIKPNKLLRFFLNRLPVIVLQKIYFLLDRNNYLKLNNSDVHNPHRLIRKIEIKLSPKVMKNDNWLNDEIKFLHLSLTAPNDYLYKKIDTRVQQRLDDGILDEVKEISTKYKWSDPGLNCLAYKEFKQYFVETRHGKSLLDTCIDKWRFDEHSYARRQKTWFKKIKHAKYLDITRGEYLKKTMFEVNKWYNQS